MRSFSIWKTAANKRPNENWVERMIARNKQRQDEDDRAGPVQVFGQERRQPLADEAARAKLLAAELNGAECERQKRRHAAEEQGGARQLRVGGVERPAPEVVPADDDQHQRNHVRGVSEQLVRELGEETRLSCRQSSTARDPTRC